MAGAREEVRQRSIMEEVGVDGHVSHREAVVCVFSEPEVTVDLFKLIKHKETQTMISSST